MIEIGLIGKVYILCPANVETGGVELLHQLAHLLNEKEIDARLIYHDSEKVVTAEVPNSYLSYNVRVSSIVDDLANSVVVLTETCFDFAFNYNSAQILFWWLSVDNFYHHKNSVQFLNIFEYFKWNKRAFLTVLRFRITKLIMQNENYFKNNYTLRKLVNRSSLNCYQSEYAHHFLLKCNISEILPLSDYINDVYVANSQAAHKQIKRDVILYNPRKGYKFTEKLIRSSPGLNWVPIVNMKKAEVLELLQTSKLYIDFGTHPGKDRIPREAVMSGCCILTNKNGSAFFFEDISVSNYYKIDERKDDIDAIMYKINDILVNYEEHRKSFNFYRAKIGKEKSKFEDEVTQAFYRENLSAALFGK